MISDLFINMLIFISFTSIGGHILKDIPKNIINSTYGKILLGVSSAFLGVLLMIYRIKVGGYNTSVDLQVLSIMTASYIGGALSTIVTGIILIICNIPYFDTNISYSIVILQISLYVTSFIIIDKYIKIACKRWLFKTILSLIIMLSTYCYILIDVKEIEIILFKFSIIIIFASILDYILLNYVKNSNELYSIYKKDSTKDYLTGLFNTRQFDKMLNLTFERTIANSERLSCLMVDIDHFKNINDTYGHGSGDMVIKELAYILKKNCRLFDIIGRVGGEEFCILLLDCPKQDSFKVALRIKEAVEKHQFHVLDNKSINVTVSIGVAVYPDTTLDLKNIRKLADSALYMAKNSGRNKVCDYTACICNNVINY